MKGYDEKLFIDEVDHEYCYRCILNGFRIIRFEHIFFEHFIGKSFFSGYFGLIAKRYRIIHSPIRVYFMVRNYLFVKKKYSSYFKSEFKQRDTEVLVSIKNNLFFSGKFFDHFK